AIGNRRGQRCGAFQVKAPGAELKARMLAGLFGNGAGQGFVIGGVAKHDLRRVEAGEGRVMFEVVKEMRDGAGLVHESSLTDRGMKRQARPAGPCLPGMSYRGHIAVPNGTTASACIISTAASWVGASNHSSSCSSVSKSFSSACMVNLLDDF